MLVAHKKTSHRDFDARFYIKIRRYLLSHLQYYHRLKALNYCVRDGNRCDHFDMFAGREHRSLFTCDDLDPLIWSEDHDPLGYPKAAPDIGSI